TSPMNFHPKSELLSPILITMKLQRMNTVVRPNITRIPIFWNPSTLPLGIIGLASMLLPWF
ncbi:MAG: hypothetical protein WC654_07600, partial [Patescibacteria group bacterium]